MSKTSIFIAATGQNVGKTTLCLGILAGLRKRYSPVGFIKPVGQQHVKVEFNINVDKDVVLFKQHFHLKADWSDMSPVIIPAGFTRQYLEGKISETNMLDQIYTSFNHIKKNNAYTVVEGTGHVGVGSIIGLNNAKIASSLGLDMVIIASGGLGSAHDELSLNIAMCKEYGVKIRGVILNKVIDEKRDMILDYFPRSLKKWEIPLIGCIPYNAFLSNPTIKDFENLFDTNLLSGENHRYQHFEHSRLVAGSLEAYEGERQSNELVITPATREDIITAVLKRHLDTKDDKRSNFCDGMILTSAIPPSRKILQLISSVDMPVLYVPLCSYDAMKMITSFIAKIRTEDVPKVEQAIALVERNIDFDLLTGNDTKSKK